MKKLALFVLIIQFFSIGCSVWLDRNYSNNPDGGFDAGSDSDFDESTCHCELTAHVAEVECVDQQCIIISCEEFYYDYDGSYQNGCEKFCDCDIENADSHCNESGDCMFENCHANFWDNNESLDDGCEHECSTENETCGLPHAASHCEESDGECILDSCIQNYFNLDNDISTGCEHFCDCVGLPHVISSYCITSGEDIGECVIETCEPSYCNNDEDSSTGCESSC